MKSLGDVSGERKNNLNIMRFLAAILVIISHSFPITNGTKEIDPLGIWTDGRLDFGGVAVSFFFVTGGFLIAGSSERKTKTKEFFIARCKRIFPSLVALCIICIFVVGGVFTTNTRYSYYTSIDTWKYLLNIVFVPVHFLPGVFSDNPYPGVVNGPLWTLPIEFCCYIACFVSYKLGFFNKKRYVFTIPLAFICAIVFFYLFYQNPFMIRIVRSVILFYIGIGFYVYRNQIHLNYKVAIVAVVLFVFLLYLKLSIIAMMFAFPYIVYYIAYGINGNYITKFGYKYEISYGMYLWGWPVQQIIVEFGGICSIWYGNAIVAIGLSVVLGFVNCVVIEKRFI